MAHDTPACSFCGKPGGRRRRLVAGPGVSICHECLEICNNLLREQEGQETAPEAGDPRAVALERLVVPRPDEIMAFLDAFVIGQAHAKKVLAVAVYNHYKRLKQGLSFQAPHPLAEVEIEKSNIMLIGPTGSGKTLLARSLARLLDVPFAITDATTLTEAGYVGEDVENILLSLIQNADGDVARAETGIVFVDEIDKIGRKTENVSITRDVSGEGVQQALLKILEGSVCRVPPGGGRKHPQQQYIKIDTSNILFICGGAFVGLDEIVRRRVGRQRIGYGGVDVDPNATLRTEPEDLVKYGLIPEFVGRLPVVTMLTELTEQELMEILVKPRHCLTRQFQKLMAMEGVELTFTDTALRELARRARQRGAGARGLRAMLETVMLDVMFEAPSRNGGNLRVTKRTVEQRLSGAGREPEALRRIA